MGRETIDNETGEIVPTTPAADIATLTAITRAEIDMQITTSRAFPRKTSVAIKRITELATLDEETAEECCYALVRKKKGQREDDDENKPIEGPSIRLAEIAFASWGNARADARVISVNRIEKYVEAEGIFHDLETNAVTRAVVRRRISTKKGYLFSDDMIVVTGNAACSIAKRNAILAGIPKGVYRPAYREARRIIAGDATTLSANRGKVYKAFAAYAVTPAQIHDLLGVGGEADVTVDHIALLRATFASIKNGEASVAEVFGKEKGNAPEGVVDPLGTSKPAEAAKNTGEGAGSAFAQSGTKAGEASATVSPVEVKETPDKPLAEAVGGHERAEPAKEPAPVEAKPTGTVVAGPPPTAAAPPAPKTPDEYKAHVMAYIAAATTVTGLQDAWKSERTLRRTLNIEKDMFDGLEAAMKDRCGELKMAVT